MVNDKTHQLVALVTGASGFIGHHMVRCLKESGYFVVAVSRSKPRFSESLADVYITGDLSDPTFTETLFTKQFDEVFHFAADMGGAGFTFSQKNDADIMQNSLRMNLNILNAIVKRSTTKPKIFYPSSACVYPELNPLDENYPKCTEHLAYPAQPDSDYGWEKLFGERLFASYKRNYGVDVRIARLHTIIGPECVFEGGREKAPAALARKVIAAEDGGEIEIWGSGDQTRSFLYIDDCLSAITQLMKCDFISPVNIGSEQLISINGLARKFIALSGKRLQLHHIEGPIGPSARNSDNRLIAQKTGWSPKFTLDQSLEITYHWIQSRMS